MNARATLIGANGAAILQKVYRKIPAYRAPVATMSPRLAIAHEPKFLVVEAFGRDYETAMGEQLDARSE